MNKLRFDLELPRRVGFLDVNDGQHRYAIDLHAPDFSKCDLLTDQEKADCAEALATALVGKQIDEPDTAPLFPDPTPEQVKERQLAATDKDMARVAEDWIAAIAAANPAALTWIKENRPDGLEKVNARRVLRGETPL